MMGFALISLTVFVVCTINLPAMAQSAEDQEALQPFRFGKFTINSCQPEDKQIVVVNSLSFEPDPLHFPGHLHVSFNITVKDTINSTLKVVVVLKVDFLGTWLEIPCFEDIAGTCNYTADQLCDVLADVCQYADNSTLDNVPCQCPVQKGTYTLSSTSIYVGSSIIPPSDYCGQVKLMRNDAEVVGCYNLFAKVGGDLSF